MKIGDRYMDLEEEEIQDLPYIIPFSDPESRDDMEAIDRMTKKDVQLRHRLFINHDWECNTIACTVVEVMANVLNSLVLKNGVSILEGDDGTIDFYDLLQLTATNKVNKRAEKVGNINIKFFPGSRVKEIIEDNTAEGTGKIEYADAKVCYTFPEDNARTDAFNKIDTLARRHLKEKYVIILPHSFNAIAIGYVFLENLYRYLIMKLVRSEKHSVMVNFNDIIEFTAEKKGDEVRVYARPGAASKMIIKSDGASEEEDYEEDEGGDE